MALPRESFPVCETLLPKLLERYLPLHSRGGRIGARSQTLAGNISARGVRSSRDRLSGLRRSTPLRFVPSAAICQSAGGEVKKLARLHPLLDPHGRVIPNVRSNSAENFAMASPIL